MLAHVLPSGGLGPGPLPGRVFRGGCSRVERRLVGWSSSRGASTPSGSPGGWNVPGWWAGLARCWVLRERALWCLLSLVGRLRCWVWVVVSGRFFGRTVLVVLLLPGLLSGVVVGGGGGGRRVWGRVPLVA